MVFRETPLARWHEAAGAKLINFAGWKLPRQYGPIAEEVTTCRKAAALFDISHMGVLAIRGEEAQIAARTVLTRDITTVPVGCNAYALLCNEQGGILDDLIVMVESDGLVRLIVNAVNHDTDFLWLRQQLGKRTHVQLGNRLYASFGVALQGPRAEEILRFAVMEGEIPQYALTHSWVKMAGYEVLVSRTGYTGEDGFEIFGQTGEAAAVWQTLLKVGKPLGMVPAGLAARDILRQEMGYPLWGQDIDATTTPLEAGLRWAIDGEGEFIGKSALEQSIPERRRIGVRMAEPGVPRRGAIITAGGNVIGMVTSGTFSHNIGAGIGQGYIAVTANINPGDTVEIAVRGQARRAQVVKFPLLPAKTKLSWIKAKRIVTPEV